MELCEKEEYRGCTINVYYDETPEDPRTWDNVATFVCEHRRYSLVMNKTLKDALTACLVIMFLPKR